MLKRSVGTLGLACGLSAWAGCGEDPDPVVAGPVGSVSTPDGGGQTAVGGLVEGVAGRVPGSRNGEYLTRLVLRLARIYSLNDDSD